MDTLYHSISTGQLTLPGNLFLAPVAGFSDAAFRTVCLRKGAVLGFTEMVSCEGIIRNNKKTTDLLIRGQGEEFLAIQLFGSDPGKFAETIPLLLPFSPAIIDINCGCPVPKVVKTGAGAALMKKPDTIGKIVAAVKNALKQSGNGHIPVSVKIRSGWDKTSLTFLEAARAAVDVGAGFIALHPRTRSQGYSGTAEWEHIHSLKADISVPVIGSGDLFTPEAARRMLMETGCDGIMFARGAIGNPWIFRNTRNLLENGTISPSFEPQELQDTITEHLDLLTKDKGEAVACREMRKHVCAYTKGMRGGAAIRRLVTSAVSINDYTTILSGLTSDLRRC